VADFRDSMTEDEYPTDPRKRQVYRWIEKQAVENAAYSVFTAPGAVDMYASRYPNVNDDSWRCILNGYDERVFERFDVDNRKLNSANKKTVLLHSGLLYPSERDPTHFFCALRYLKDRNARELDNLEIRLRASGYEDELQEKIDNANIGDIVKLLPAIGYADALKEMLEADGLLVFQASNCNHQIPAKIYEYMRARRPILALTNLTGDTATLLRQSGVSTLSSLDVSDSIVAALLSFLSMIECNSAPIASDEAILSFSRRSQTRELAALFDSITR
jgi:glycosyltransferase involved in cell wall biosynthesis